MRALKSDCCRILPAWNEETLTLPLEALGDALGEARLDWQAIEAGIRFDPTRYHREILFRTPEFELVLASWLPGQISTIHDHFGSEGATRVLRGQLEETLFSPDGERAVPIATFGRRSGAILLERKDTLHQVRNTAGEPAVSLHLYRPPLAGMRTYRLADEL